MRKADAVCRWSFCVRVFTCNDTAAKIGRGIVNVARRYGQEAADALLWLIKQGGDYVDEGVGVVDDKIDEIVDEIGEVVDELPPGALPPITPPTDRNGLRKALGPKPYEKAQAHHGLPWTLRDWFAKKGLNVNDPKYGAWVMGGGNGGHASWSYDYNKEWKRFIDEHLDATARQIVDHLNKIRGDVRWGGGF